MKKILLGVFALVLGLALCGEASAQGHRRHGPAPRHGHGHGPVHVHRPGRVHGHVHVHVGARPYYARHGVRFSGGYYYPGHTHSHWGFRVYSSEFGRYHYWDSDARCYYYYCPERCGYYPVVIR